MKNYKNISVGRPKCGKYSGKSKLDQHKEDILTDLEKGIKKCEIAKKYNVCPNTVTNFTRYRN